MEEEHKKRRWRDDEEEDGSVTEEHVNVIKKRPKENKRERDESKGTEMAVREAEVEWMLARRPLVHDTDQLVVDYGQEEADAMLQAFRSAGREALLPCLAWHGVASRYRAFLAWLLQPERKEASRDWQPREAFAGFAHHLCRVVSYRALAITGKQYETIRQADSIHPSGRLRTDAETLEALTLKEGVRKVLYARLYIGLGLLPYDPSLSLHDDPETAVCIASGYMELPHRPVHLFKLSVPKIEVSGFIVADIQDDKKRWFKHRHIYFDAMDERTERYTLYEIPFLSTRLLEHRVFQSTEEVQAFLLPFKEQQQKKMEASVNASSAPPHKPLVSEDSTHE